MATKKLNEQLWAVAREYARLFGEIIGAEPEHWVGDTPDMCCFGDCYFFTLEEMRGVVDKIDEHTERYGTKEAVGDEVRDWVDWWLDDIPDGEASGTTVMEHVEARVTRQLRPNITLEAWLGGCPREERTPWSGPDAEYMRLKQTHQLLIGLIKDYGPDNTLENVFVDVDQDLERETAAKRKRDKEEFERLTVKFGEV